MCILGFLKIDDEPENCNSCTAAKQCLVPSGGEEAYPAGGQQAEQEGDPCRQQLGAKVLRPDGGEVAEEAEGDLASAELLCPAERLQPGVQLPADAWSEHRDESKTGLSLIDDSA